MREREEEGDGMKCACALPRPLNLPIIGIQRGLDETPAVILWNCICKSTRGIRWADATTQQREQAFLAEESRNAASEMMIR
jgi:hypothetical protein